MLDSSHTRAVVVMGVAGSGKSTVGQAVADALGWRFCEGDDYHSPENVAKMSSGVPLTDGDRAPWLKALHDEIDASLDRGESIVLACSALKAEYRDRLLEGNDAMLVYLHGDPDIIHDRMKSRRQHYMGSAMLESQLATIEEPHSAFVVDIAHDADVIVGLIVAEIRSR